MLENEENRENSEKISAVEKEDGMSINSELSAKKGKLINYLKGCQNAVIAFSSGVDSTYLAYMAKEILGDKMLAVTVKASAIPERELTEGRMFCEKNEIKQVVIELDQLSIKEFAANVPERCYYCKKEIFDSIIKVAADNGIENIFDGSNVDDLSDYRPGLKALKELKIKSPLVEAGLTKKDIRLLSKEIGLHTWDKPSFACLASRIPYNEVITKKKLEMVEKAEQKLYEMGFKQFRVRHHGKIARIEVLPEDFERIIRKEISKEIYGYFEKLGFDYTALDISGYKTGNMNKNKN